MNIEPIQFEASLKNSFKSRFFILGILLPALIKRKSKSGTGSGVDLKLNKNKQKAKNYV